MFKPRFIEWDPGNEQDHVAKRGIPFAIGADVFIDADRVEISAKPDRFGSPRFKTVGRVGGITYAVIFAIKDDTAHIVSVRKASKRERLWP